MRKHFRTLFAALAFATLGPLGCVVGDTASEDETPALEASELITNECTKQCDSFIYECLYFWIPAGNPNYTVESCIRYHQECLLKCPYCGCESGSWCCRDSSGRLECGAQGTCVGGDDGGGDGGGGGGGGGCSTDWDCSPTDECSSGTCVPLGCG